MEIEWKQKPQNDPLWDKSNREEREKREKHL
jgi:hypothetical protein